MDRETRRRLEAWRAEAPDPHNAVVDDLFSGECDRAGFIKRATMFGLSVPAMSAALVAAGEAPLALAKPARVKAGGRLRLGITPIPKGTLEPWTYQETGALQLGGISGEFLNRTQQNLTVTPELAVSWKPNSDGSEWTYKIRQGVKFANGKPMNADDVLSTYARLLTDDTSQAGSAFSGVLSPAGVTKVDDFTVSFKLDTPTTSFPYLTSSTTYQAIILPKDYAGTYQGQPSQSTGAFNLVAYTPGVSARYDRNPNWWGGQAALDGVDVTLGEDTAIINALIGGQLDLLNGIVFANSRALFNNSNVKIFSAKGATHRQIPMRVDTGVLKDKRVRQAIALTLNRPQIKKTLFNDLADLGNESPFAPVYPSTSKGVAQRKKDLAKAKALISAAGLKPGWKTRLVTYQTAKLPQLAQIVKQAVKSIGGNVEVKILTGTQYYSGTPTTTPWLNEPMTITDWGHRGVPNVLLNAALTSKAVPSKKAGTWNAAHFKNKKYDALVKSFGAAVSLADQRKYSRQIQLLLLDETPVIFPYFYNSLNAGSPKVTGFKVDQLGQIYLSKTSLA